MDERFGLLFSGGSAVIEWQPSRKDVTLGQGLSSAESGP
jgi:hypothetical protein